MRFLFLLSFCTALLFGKDAFSNHLSWKATEICQNHAKKNELIKGVCENNLSLIKEAVNKGADINKPIGDSYSKMPPIVLSTALNFPLVVEALANLGADIGGTGDVYDFGKIFPLYVAAYDANLEVANTLLSKGANVNQLLIGTGATALHALVRNEESDLAAVKELIKVFLSYGAKIDSKNENGNTPLAIATYVGRPEVLKTLLEQGGKVSDTFNGTPLIIYSSGDCNLEAVKILIGAGADVNSLGPKNTTALIAVSQSNIFSEIKKRNCVETLNLLFASGYHGVDLRESDGQTALMKAALNHLSMTEIIKVIIRAGANLDLQDKKGNTALHLTADVSEGDRMYREGIALIEAGAALNFQNIEGDTPLHLAIRSLSDELASALISKGANLNVENVEHHRALNEANYNSRFNIFQQLIKAGAEINYLDGRKVAPLHYAVRNGEKYVKALLDGGADINIRTGPSDGWNPGLLTPLMIAARDGELDVVRLLIRAGADINLRNSRGHTALKMANNDGVREVIQKAGGIE